MAALDNVYEFTMEVPEELDGVEVTDLTFEHAFRGVHVVTNGWVNGNDGSFFDLPYYQEVDATA
ncbi:MAG: hypothetical protein KY469_00840 [Actinobacteria bacterium]|nr:hypothetical protein [Actinomycetota bacterium]